MNSTRVFFILFLVILTGIFITAYNLHHHPSVAQAPLMHKVLIVDLNKNGLFTTAGLNKGEDALIVLKPTGDHDHNEDWISGLEALQNYDVNKDGRIDKKDPMYARLGLMFFPGDAEKRNFVSLEKAGVKAIIFNTKSFKSQKKRVVAGYVIMRDGSERKINVIAVDYQ